MIGFGVSPRRFLTDVNDAETTTHTHYIGQQRAIHHHTRTQRTSQGTENKNPTNCASANKLLSAFGPTAQPGESSLARHACDIALGKMSAGIVYEGVARGGSGSLFKDVKFWISQKVPQRHTWVHNVEVSGAPAIVLPSPKLTLSRAMEAKSSSSRRWPTI